MPSETTRILTINGGSSSIKFALFEDAQAPRRILSGAIERIGGPRALLKTTGATPSDAASRPIEAPDHRAAVGVLMDYLGQSESGRQLTAIGHRVVHGGPRYSEPCLITAEMIDDLRAFEPFDPKHLPEEILLMSALRDRFPDLPQIACFDTAFHRDMPRVAQILAIPRRYQDKGVRRYGFHGLSYQYLIGELARLDGEAAANGRVVLAHLGAGASLAATRHGKSVDTSMGFTPTAGIPMATRSGDIDPGLVAYLAGAEGMTAEQFGQMVNSESGLLGVSGVSSDMRDLLALEASDANAADAVAMFGYAVKKTIGAYSAALGGLDALVFAGGIGEHSPQTRARICAGLEYLGVEIDAERNAANEAVISRDGARVKIRVIATDEELVIARSVVELLKLP